MKKASDGSNRLTLFFRWHSSAAASNAHTNAIKLKKTARIIANCSTPIPPPSEFAFFTLTNTFRNLTLESH